LDFYEIWICCSKFNLAHSHRWEFWDIILGGRKRNRMKTVQAEASISSLFLWRSRILLKQSEEKLEESQGTSIDAAIIVGRHVSPLRGKGWVIHNWELVRTCVGILRDINWNEFLGVFAISFYPYNYYSKLYMFDKPIVVKLICYCVEHEPYKSNIFLINMNWWNKGKTYI